MVSRLMLNLHRTAADQGDVFGTTLDPTSIYTHNGDMQFTTHPIPDTTVSVSHSEHPGSELYGHVRVPIMRRALGRTGRDVGQVSSDLSTETDLEMKDFRMDMNIGSV